MEARRSLFEDGDQRNDVTDAENSGGSGITRIISRERVALIVRLAGKIWAMCRPSGLGKEWEEAVGY